MAITNATRLSDFAAGIGTEGAILQIDNANQRIGIGTQLPSQMLEVAGIITAQGYRGDGSLLEGITSAGLGTAIGDTNTVEEVIYYTDDLLTVAETTTVNPPASASAAYTQYRDVKLDDNVDLIIETGDDFIPDILGFGDDKSNPNAAGNGVYDQVYTDIIKNKDGLGAPTFANGLTSVGVITAASGSFSGNVTVGGVLKYEDVINVDSVGLITARTGIKVIAGGIDVGDGNITNVGEISLDVIKPDNGSSILIRSDTDKNLSVRGNIGEIGDVTGFQATNDAESALTDFGIRATTIRFATGSSERLRIGDAGQLGIAGANYGTDGQVLTSKGASAAVQWADAAGGTTADALWQSSNAPNSTWNNEVWGGAHSSTLARKSGFPTKAGVQMSDSSGVFTFPETGTWKIDWNIKITTGMNDWWRLYMQESTNSGSTWDGDGVALGGIWYGWCGNYTNNYDSISYHTTTNVTNTSTYRVRGILKSPGNMEVYAKSWIIFTKLT